MLSRRLFAATRSLSLYSTKPTSLFHTAISRPTMADAAPTRSNQPQKRKFNEGKRHFKKNKKQKQATVKEGSNEEVLIADVRALLEKHSIGSKPEQSEEQVPPSQLPEPFTEYDLTIEELASTGDGLAVIPGTSQIAVVPSSRSSNPRHIAMTPCQSVATSRNALVASSSSSLTNISSTTRRVSSKRPTKTSATCPHT